MVVDKADIQTIEFTISGMTCNGCAEHVKHEVNKLDGIIAINASYENGVLLINLPKKEEAKVQAKRMIEIS